MGPRELESLTSSVSTRRSNQLSYGPAKPSYQTCRGLTKQEPKKPPDLRAAGGPSSRYSSLILLASLTPTVRAPHERSYAASLPTASRNSCLLPHFVGSSRFPSAFGFHLRALSQALPICESVIACATTPRFFLASAIVEAPAWSLETATLYHMYASE